MSTIIIKFFTTNELSRISLFVERHREQHSRRVSDHNSHIAVQESTPTGKKLAKDQDRISTRSELSRALGNHVNAIEKSRNFLRDFELPKMQ